MVHDAELVRASLAGSPVAFAVLVTRHRERARRAAARLLRDPDEAEDVTQEALLQAYLGLAALRDRERFGAWLTAIAANLARMRLRSRGAAAAAAPELERGAPEPADGMLADVREALTRLPRGEREAVLACDVLGLSREEAGRALATSPGAVRVRLHRGRARLRELLPQHVPTTRKEREMVEVEVREVLTRVGEDGGLAVPGPQLGAVHVVLLAERDGARLLPIWIGPPEAGALAMQLAGEELPRPMSADLMARLVEALGGRVERVVVSALRERTFFAAVALQGPSGRVEVDARPSDALNLARRLDAPILVDEAVLAEAAVAADALEETLDRLEEHTTGRTPTGTWRTLSAELVRSFWEAQR